MFIAAVLSLTAACVAPSPQGRAPFARQVAAAVVGVPVYPRAGLRADVPMWSGERKVVGSAVRDRSGNGHDISFIGTLRSGGIVAAGAFTPLSWPTLGDEMTFVEVQRYWNQGFVRTYQFGGGQNSFYVQRQSLAIRNNAAGLQQRDVGFMANTQPSWFHAHIVTVFADGRVVLHRSMLEPMAGWETNEDATLDHRGMIRGRRLQNIDLSPGNELRHVMLYDRALVGRDLANLKAALLADHRSPHGGGPWPRMGDYVKLFETRFDLVHDPAAQARSPVMGSAVGGVRLDRTVAEDYADRRGVSDRCLRMQFDGSHGGWSPGQRFMNLVSQINDRHEDMILEWTYCVTGLDLSTSLGAKMAPSVSFGGVPSPCVPIPMNEGYISMMSRPPRRNLVPSNTPRSGAVVHGYNYFQGALDPCGQHMHCYNPDGSFFRMQRDTWYRFRHRIRLNDVGRSNGVFQIQIDGKLAQSDGNLVMRDDPAVKLRNVTCEFFSGGSWPWVGSGHVRLGDLSVYVPR